MNKTIKLMVAEDDRFLSSAYNLKFKKEGFDVVFVSNGEELLSKLKSFLPNVIILDLMMPKMDGFTTLATLKKDNQFSSIPIIVASNLGQKEDIDKALLLGANDYIIKSDLSMADIVSKIRALAK